MSVLHHLAYYSSKALKNGMTSTLLEGIELDCIFKSLSDQGQGNTTKVC